MKAVFFILILILTISLLVLGGVLYPYYVYHQAMNTGVESRFVAVSKSSLTKFQAVKFDEKKFKHLEIIEEFWEEFHMRNLSLKLPSKNPSYNFYPKPVERNNGTDLGLYIKDVSRTNLNEVIEVEPTKFDLFPFNDKIFSFPIFEKFIETKSKKEIWKDLYTFKVKALPFDRANFIRSVNKIRRISFEELMYNLYILKLRSYYFGDHFNKKYMLIESRELGVVTTETSTDIIDKVQFLKEGMIYKFLLKTYKGSRNAEKFRLSFFRYAYFYPKSKQASELIYGKFKSLTFDDKTSQLGFLYLYGSWSHLSSSKKFLEELIFYLERGKENVFVLTPLYEYAYDKYGTNFSQIDAKESAEKRLEKGIENELEKELDYAKEESLETPTDFKSKDVETNYYLNKAKDDSFNSDDQDDEILSY